MKRNTHQQQMVCDVLDAFKGLHPTADKIYAQVALSMPSISRATVYRILNNIAEDGVIQRVHIPASADRYDDHLGPHYHMRCNDCGQIFDVAMPVMESIYKKLPATSEYEVSGHDIVFTGLCAKCK